jgi:hypothetical protein
MSGYMTWNNIRLRNVTINDPENSPGVIMGNSTNPIRNLIFDNVIVKNPVSDPWKYYYVQCVEGVSIGNTSPVPNNFSIFKPTFQ